MEAVVRAAMAIAADAACERQDRAVTSLNYRALPELGSGHNKFHQ